MQPSKETCNSKTNLETAVPSLSSKTFNSYCQLKCSAVGNNNCDKYLNEKYGSYKPSQEPPKKLNCEFVPCPAFNKYSSGAHGSSLTDGKYGTCPSYKPYEKDFSSRNKYPERENTNFYSCLDKFKYSDLEGDHNSQYKKKPGTFFIRLFLISLEDFFIF